MLTVFRVHPITELTAPMCAAVGAHKLSQDRDTSAWYSSRAVIQCGGIMLLLSTKRWSRGVASDKMFLCTKSVWLCWDSPMRPIFMPERARALRADWAPGPGVLVLRKTGSSVNIGREVFRSTYSCDVSSTRWPSQQSSTTDPFHVHVIWE